MKPFLRRWHDWWHTSQSWGARWLRAADAALLGDMTAMAAGTALFAILAIVPTIAAAVAIFGLVADASEIRDHLRGLESVVPQQVVDFLGDQLERQAQRSNGELGFQLVTSIVLAVYSARGSAQALISSLNRAYRVRDVRGPFVRLGLSFAIAGAALLGLVFVLTTAVATPGVIAILPVRIDPIIAWLRWPTLLAFLCFGLYGVYRVAPSPRPLGTERHTWPGAVIATALLVIVSWALSEWVKHVANYELFYGAFGSVIVILLWFYLSTIAIVIGGFINAELEREAGAPQPDKAVHAVQVPVNERT